MAQEAVQPLRINKMAAATTSPSKLPRPLSEIGTTERRRNSPSYNQATRKMIVTRDTSPFDTSPFKAPNAFWNNKEDLSPTRFASENSPERELPTVSSAKRSSIENLKKASRVANSPMFARENKDKYDPSSSPILERPLTDRPLSGRIQQNAFARYDSIRKENNPFTSPDLSMHRRTESKTDNILSSPTKSPATTQSSTPRDGNSPIKSSLTSNSRYGHSPLGFDPESGTWSGDDDDMHVSTPRGSLRPAKSVTFHTAPPEIKEYEQQTPEPSSVASGSRESSYESEEYEENSFDRGSSTGHDDSFDESLEDTTKTPVVLPGDWHNVSPETARTDLVDDYDDVFDEDAGSPPPTATPSRLREPIVTVRSESVTSDGSTRPLPPLPGFNSPIRGRRSSGSLTAAAERASSVQRSLPSPPRPASVSKSEILRMRETNMSLEDRMGLLALQESLAADANSPQLIGASSPGRLSDNQSPHLAQDTEAEAEDDVADLPDFEFAPKISRESILRKVKSDRNEEFAEDEFAEDESIYSDSIRNYSELANMDPDVAIPSRETSTHFDQAAADIIIKEEEPDSPMNLSTIPAAAASNDPAMLGGSPARDDQERQSSVIHHQLRASEESEDSRYSSPMYSAEQTVSRLQGTGLGISHDEAFSTPLEEPVKKELPKEVSLPFLTDFFGKDDYDFGLKHYITPSPPASSDKEKAPILDTAFESRDLRVSVDSSTQSDATVQETSAVDISEPLVELPVIPERKATIKTGGKLKARPSGTPADFQALAESRRQLSEEYPPPIPDKYRSDISDRPQTADSESKLSQHSIAESTVSDGSKNDSGVEQDQTRRESRKPNLSLALPAGESDSGSGLSLSEEMERVIQSQKKGYLMRQNTKVVVASTRNFSDESAPPMSPTSELAPFAKSERGTRSAGSSPRKPSTGEKFISTEPWNGKVRRKSLRQSSSRRQSNMSGPTPSLPGHESALGVVDEYSTIEENDEETERGRLFVKVVGVKELDLPLPRNDRLYFQLTLDNGLHCVTTANLELGKSAQIGQEFELVVLSDLEFQLTLTTKLPPPTKVAQHAAAPLSPTKAPKSPTKSAFSRLLSSPKKRAEKERKEREEAEEIERRRQEEIERRRIATKPTAWDKLREVVDASTGSFGRSYISLKSHEELCFGRQLTVDVPLFNEWAQEKDASVVSSVRSKRTNGTMSTRGDGVIRCPPYTVGKLELQLLYVPRPKDAGDDDMPTSMSSALREMTSAEQVKEAKWEGSLSQQGGDCPYWRRRFFRLQGTKLTAYHEHTHQPRATINLSKASRLIDDKSSLVADPTAGNPSSKSRRKSAFAEEDDGYQFVEEGFRIRFANGETIDFYADNRAQKEEWMQALSQSVGKQSAAAKPKWTDLVLTKERAEAKSAAATPQSVQGELTGNPSIRIQAPSVRTSSNGSVPASPMTKSKSTLRHSVPSPVREAPSVPPKDTKRPSTPPLSPRTGHRDRKAVQSMIF